MLWFGCSATTRLGDILIRSSIRNFKQTILIKPGVDGSRIKPVTVKEKSRVLRKSVAWCSLAQPISKAGFEMLKASESLTALQDLTLKSSLSTSCRCKVNVDNLHIILEGGKKLTTVNPSDATTAT